MITKFSNLLKPALLIGAVMCCFSCNYKSTKVTQRFGYMLLLDSTTGINSRAVGMSSLRDTIIIKTCKHGADWYHPISDGTMCDDTLFIK
jgi:hypothetical protein